MVGRSFTPAGCSFILPQETPGQPQAELKMTAHLAGVGAGQSPVGCQRFDARGTRATAGSSMFQGRQLPRCHLLTAWSKQGQPNPADGHQWRHLLPAWLPVPVSPAGQPPPPCTMTEALLPGQSHPALAGQGSTPAIPPSSREQIILLQHRPELGESSALSLASPLPMHKQACSSAQWQSCHHPPAWDLAPWEDQFFSPWTMDSLKAKAFFFFFFPSAKCSGQVS